MPTLTSHLSIHSYSCSQIQPNSIQQQRNEHQCRSKPQRLKNWSKRTKMPLWLLYLSRWNKFWLSMDIILWIESFCLWISILLIIFWSLLSLRKKGKKNDLIIHHIYHTIVSRIMLFTYNFESLEHASAIL